jgi:NAD(P)-dependent dehydrogenase (short-subunit alcohol dehydrogenase family)
MTRTKRKIVISGCSSGFGRLMADKFAEQGWCVLATTRHPEQFQFVPENLQVLAADVATTDGCASVVEYIEKNWSGKLDCLVNNAGYCLSGPLEMLSAEQIRDQMEVNFFAAVLLTRDLLPGLRATRGKIINLSSILGFVGMPLMSLYAGSKHALEGWSESLHYELESHGVQVAIVEPAGYRTGFAQHMEWPPQDVQNNFTYGPQWRGFKNSHARLSQQGKGNPPVEVIDRVVRLANAHKMPLRTRVGGNAHALYYLRRILPQRMADFLIGLLGKKLTKEK